MNIALFRKYLGSQEFEKDLTYRIERLQAAESNPVDRIGIIYDIQDDPLLFCKLFGMVYEPRLPENPDIPFFLFPYQKDLMLRIMEAENRGEDLLVEKTRDMGVTWVVIWYILWRWLTREKWYCLVGSRKEEEVDNRAPSSLFGKLRYALYSLPPWIRPVNFRKSDHDLFKKLINPQRMSYIEGESANPFFGRGKRVSFLFMDELFFWKFARESWRSSTDTSLCRVAVSTAKASSFARTLRDSFAEQNRLITLDWRMHPFKDEEWFQKEVERRKADPLSVEAELEIKYSVDPTLVYYPEVQNCPIQEIDFNPELPLYIGLDFGVRDKTAIVYVQRSPTNYYVLDAFEKANKPIFWFLPFLKPGYDFQDREEYEIVSKLSQEKIILKKSNYLPNELEKIRRFNSWSPPLRYFGEVAHRMRMAKTNTSIVQEMLGVGIYITINDFASSHEIRRKAVKSILPRTIFSSKYDAIDLYDALENSVYSNSEKKDEPKHDENADLRAAFENFAVNIIPTSGKIKEIIYKR
jgi:hypothetical protein